MTLHKDSILVACKDHFSCEVSGEAVILDMRSGTYFGLNRVGASAWKLLAMPCTLPRLRDAIVAEYDVEPSCCESDLTTLLEQLLEQNLIEVQS